VYDYQAQVLNVHDGDTLRLRTDLGFYIRFDQTVRLAGLNAPELSTPEGKAAQAFELMAGIFDPRMGGGRGMGMGRGQGR